MKNGSEVTAFVKDHESLTFYWWYGTVNGEKASFSYEECVEMVEIDKN